MPDVFAVLLFSLSCVSSPLSEPESLAANAATATPEESNVPPSQPGIPDLTPTILTRSNELRLEGSEFFATLYDYRFSRTRGTGKTEGLSAWADIGIRDESGHAERISRWKFYEIQTVLGRRFSLRGNEDEVRLYLLPVPPELSP